MSLKQANLPSDKEGKSYSNILQGAHLQRIIFYKELNEKLEKIEKSSDVEYLKKQVHSYTFNFNLSLDDIQLIEEDLGANQISKIKQLIKTRYSNCSEDFILKLDEFKKRILSVKEEVQQRVDFDITPFLVKSFAEEMNISTLELEEIELNFILVLEDLRKSKINWFTNEAKLMGMTREHSERVFDNIENLFVKKIGLIYGEQLPSTTITKEKGGSYFFWYREDEKKKGVFATVSSYFSGMLEGKLRKTKSEVDVNTIETSIDVDIVSEIKDSISSISDLNAKKYCITWLELYNSLEDGERITDDLIAKQGFGCTRQHFNTNIKPNVMSILKKHFAEFKIKNIKK